MERKRYMLIRVVPANYQNGNTTKAMTRNITKNEQLAMGNDFNALKEYANSIRACAPLYIEDRDTGEKIYKIER